MINNKLEALKKGFYIKTVMSFGKDVIDITISDGEKTLHKVISTYEAEKVEYDGIDSVIEDMCAEILKG